MPSLSTDTPTTVRPGEEIDIQALNRFLQQAAPHIGEVLNIEQFPGGFSNLTYCLHTSDQQYVLRRPPFGTNIKSAHDMSREFTVLSLLKPHYPLVPTPVIYCDQESVLGSPFYIMERIPGVILRAAHAPRLNFAPDRWRQTSVALVDNLVKLHALDINATGLAVLGKSEGYVQRQVEGWIKRYYHAETDTIASLDQIADWMKDNQPESPSPTLLHNDYKYDNVVLHPDNLSEIRGVLDWEMSTVGDPLMDLGASLAYWSEADDTPAIKFFNLTWLPGNLSKQQVIDRYAEKSGRDVKNILFYYIFGLYKNAVIVQQIYARWKAGYTQDPRFGTLLPIVQALGTKAENALMSGKW